jgi:hypothetical protein
MTVFVLSLFHGTVPTMFRLEALNTATHTLNRSPCRPRNDATPYQLLYGHMPSYDHLRMFGCQCYPNLSATAAHKLSPRSVACVFLGYPIDTKGYRRYNPDTNRVITFRHVYFDEDVFPFRSKDTGVAPSMPAPLPDSTSSKRRRPRSACTPCRATTGTCCTGRARRRAPLTRPVVIELPPLSTAALRGPQRLLPA